MSIKPGLVSDQVVASANFVKSPSFSKDAEIAEKVIEHATNGLSLSEGFVSPRSLDPAEVTVGFSPLTRRTNVVASARCSDRDFDGYFLGANEEAFAPATNVDKIPTVDPRGGARNDKKLIYINGISATKKRQAESLRLIADHTGSRVVGIYNHAQNGLLDIAQFAAGANPDVGCNPALETMTETIYSQLRAGRSLHLLAHSQGAIVVSRAIQNVSNCLRLEDGLSKAETKNLLSNVSVETFGGAARRYPAGPQYVHYINRRDLVPQLFGLREFLNPLVAAGENAVIHHFNSGKGFLAHEFESVYLCQRVPFEVARNDNLSR